MKATRKIKKKPKKQVIAIRKNPLLIEDVQQLATKDSGKRDEKNLMFYPTVELLVLKYIMEVFANVCQATSFHSCRVSHRYNRAPHVLHVSQESVFLDKQKSNYAATHLSFSNHKLAFHD